MRRLPINIDKIMNEDKFKEYYSLGLIDEVVLRNFKIKWEYYNLRKSMPIIDSLYLLSEKYFLSFDSINSILFRARNQKKITPPDLGANQHTTPIEPA